MFCRRSCPSGRILNCSAICFTGIILVNTKKSLESIFIVSLSCSFSLVFKRPLPPAVDFECSPFLSCSKALGGSSQPWLSPCWILTMDVHYAFMCVHPRLVLPQSNILALFAFPETLSCPQVQYFIRKPSSYLLCSLIWHDLFSDRAQLSDKPWLSLFSTKHKKLTLPCIPSKLCCPPVYHLSTPDLPIYPLTEANAGVNLLFLNIPFS